MKKKNIAAEGGQRDKEIRYFVILGATRNVASRSTFSSRCPWRFSLQETCLALLDFNTAP